MTSRSICTPCMQSSLFVCTCAVGILMHYSCAYLVLREWIAGPCPPNQHQSLSSSKASHGPRQAHIYQPLIWKPFSPSPQIRWKITISTALFTRALTWDFIHRRIYTAHLPIAILHISLQRYCGQSTLVHPACNFTAALSPSPFWFLRYR